MWKKSTDMYIFDVCTSYVDILYSLDILLKIICLISKAKKKKKNWNWGKF